MPLSSDRDMEEIYYLNQELKKAMDRHEALLSACTAVVNAPKGLTSPSHPSSLFNDHRIPRNTKR